MQDLLNFMLDELLFNFFSYFNGKRKIIKSVGYFQFGHCSMTHKQTNEICTIACLFVNL